MTDQLRWTGVGGLLVLLGLAPYLGLPVHVQSLLYVLFFWVTLATSWNMLSGYSGYFSFGHGAFFGVGMYGMATFATQLAWPLWAALLLGVADVAGKYYIPKMGAFIVYTLMIAILIWRPQGLFVRQGGKS